MAQERGQWGSRLGFILAAAGSAIGLGNIWKFPYITGKNGGGAFVLVYLGCIALVGLPVMMAEILLGRRAQTSPVGAFRALSRPRSPWMSVGWVGVACAFVILSFYSVVAGWTLHYLVLSLQSGFAGGDAEAVKATFGALYRSGPQNLLWHAVVMVVTVAIVIGGVQRGVERAARVLMPALFVMMLALLGYATTLGGFGRAFDFVFGFHAADLDAAGVLEALGHAFFTLSVGMGAMLTYGSYLGPREDVVGTSIAITALDTIISLTACLVIFPITFTEGLEPAAGPGLVFINLPLALVKLPGGALWGAVFFLLLAFAAITSAISLLEVAAAYFIDERRWTRRKAVLLTGGVTFVVGVPSALSGGSGLFGEGMAGAVGKSWFDWVDYLSSNWMLPLGGIGIALFVAYRLDPGARREAFATGSRLGALSAFYVGWLQLLRFVVPVAILLVMLNALGLLPIARH